MLVLLIEVIDNPENITKEFVFNRNIYTHILSKTSLSFKY